MKWFLDNEKITLFLVTLLLAFGFYGLAVMPKDEFPAFTIRQGVVVAVMPGATPEEMEEQVARPLERHIFTYKEVNRAKTYSTCTAGMCIIMVQFHDDQNNLTPIWSRMKHNIAAFKQQSLPAGVIALQIQDDFGDTSALLVTLESNQRSYRELQGYSDELADRVRRLPSVSKVQQLGEVKEQLTLSVDRQRLAAYGIGELALLQAIKADGLTTMSGAVATPTNNIAIHLAPTADTEQELRDRVIYTDPKTGTTLRVGDIATVVREYDEQSPFIQSNGKRAVVLSLEMLGGNNIVQYGRDIDRVLEQFRSDYLPDDVDMRRIVDQPQVVGDSVHDFLRDLIISMAIIIVVMMLLFPFTSALVASLTIPLSTFISVGIMYAVGIELNTISLACLIVVLGMIVDNSIIVIDGYLEYLRAGEPRREAALHAIRQYFWPMLLATVCICVIFYPLLITMTGEAADVVRLFPFTMTINLMVSLAIAAVVIPLLNTRLIRTVKAKDPDHPDVTDYVQRLYDRCLTACFRHPWATIATAIVLCAASGALFTQLKVRQFPYAERQQFAVEIYMPPTAGIRDAQAIADSLTAALRKDQRVTGVTAFVGMSAPRFHLSYAPPVATKGFAQLIVNTTSTDDTQDVLRKYSALYANHWPQAYVRWKQMDYLPCPTYEYRFYGADIDSLQQAADTLMAEMRRIPDLEWIHTDYDNTTPVVEVRLDPVAAAQAGLSRTAAELQLALATSKLQIGSIWEPGPDDPEARTYEVPVVLRDPATDTLTVADIANTYITTPSVTLNPQGHSSLLTPHSSLPLRQVATVQPEWLGTKIVHRGGERCISVQAEGKYGVFALAIQNRLISFIDHMKLPRAVRAEIGGETEKNSEMVPQIFGGIALAMVVIFFFLLFNFRKFTIAILSIIAIALGMPGAVLGLYISGKVLGLTSMFGFITLMGMVMRNEILIFEHANQKRAEGMSPRDAAFDAGRRRMVPIFLTTATTAVGVVPMIITGSSFWQPVGITIFAGGIGMLVLLTLTLPVVYWKLYDKKAAPAD